MPCVKLPWPGTRKQWHSSGKQFHSYRSDKPLVQMMLHTFTETLHLSLLPMETKLSKETIKVKQGGKGCINKGWDYIKYKYISSMYESVHHTLSHHAETPEAPYVCFIKGSPADSPRSGCRYRAGTCVQCEPPAPRTRHAPPKTLTGHAGTVRRTGGVVPTLHCAPRMLGRCLAGPRAPGPALPRWGLHRTGPRRQSRPT